MAGSWANGSSSKGVGLMAASGVMFCLMSILIRRAADVDSFMVAQFRFMIGLALLGSAALSGRIVLRFQNGPLLFLRGLTGGISVVLFFLSIAKLGIGKGTVISYCYPVFASLIGAVFLKERLGPIRVPAICAALGGMVLLSLGRSAGGGLDWHVGRYEVLAFIGAVMSGIAVVVVRKLHQTDSTYAIFFSQCLVGLWLVVIPANVSGDSLGYAGGTMLLCIGVLAAVGQLLMTEGYRHVTVTTGSLLGMLTPVLNVLVGLVLFRERLSGHAIFGAVLVLAACSVVILAERIEERGRQSAV